MDKDKEIEQLKSIIKEQDEQLRLLSAGYSYKIGKFQVILDEDTEELKVIVCTNKDRMIIKPNTDNSCTLVACR